MTSYETKRTSPYTSLVLWTTWSLRQFKTISTHINSCKHKAPKYRTNVVLFFFSFSFLNIDNRAVRPQTEYKNTVQV